MPSSEGAGNHTLDREITPYTQRAFFAGPVGKKGGGKQ